MNYYIDINQKTTQIMDYKNATIQHMFRNVRKYRNSLEQTLSQIPKGWIYITKNGTYDTMTPEERVEFVENIRQQKIQRIMSDYVSKFVNRKREELERDGYDEEEIEAYIDELFYDDEETYETYEYNDVQYYSSDSYDY